MTFIPGLSQAEAIAVGHSVALPQLLIDAQTQVKADLLHVIDQQDWPEILHKAVRHAALQGGKRVRPALVYMACAACALDDVLYPAAARRAAVAIELIHCYSLVHDDLPCMDDDELRRGQPTVHVVYGEANALLAGDVLQSLAFEVLSGSWFSDQTLSASVQLAQMQSLSQAASQMVKGQLLDLAAETKQVGEQELETIHVNKTGALIRSAVRMGAYAAGMMTPAVLNDLDRFAYALGLAFQVQDDVLDVTSTTETLGKPAGSDEKLQKSTYPSLLGLTAAQQRAIDLHHEAIQALAGFDQRADGLRALADFLLKRTA
ncbi:polyprenyl synthetase family protein [Aquirhabdus parva]|uniref:Polyprenyl synthetase family protein n=1 Tax=Aquirhabdus parva TaxID=2283318 RepID=A0A345P2L8_9GAMM|nr:farnesyl diphosphate synthase [Aquirhabdus parva]AXI01527.1 polyprenyl synthetase family protein [Aquirhabdus parva]